MRRAFFLWAYLLCGTSLLASSLNLDGRVEIQNTGRDLANYTALVEPSPWLGLKYKAGVRLAHSMKDLETLGYGIETSYPLLNFFEPTLRLSTENWLNSTTAITHLLFLGSLKFRLFDFMRVFMEGGWYQRFVRLNRPYFLPAFFGGNYTEHDFALNFGTEILWSEQLTTLFKVATFEELSVYNLNNPYLQGQFSYTPDSSKTLWSVYARYRLLLGFGRMDSFTVGLNYTILN